jgi:HD-GYP domain-containing protein (c-di-GMP phosphodiesterase class II)
MALIRLAELLGRLSLAFDIANDSPHGKAVRSTVLAVEVGKRAGASDEELRDSYWVAMLSHLGCTGFAHDEGLMGAGDDRALRNATSMFSIDDPLPSARDALRRIAPNVSLARRVQVLAGILSDRTLFQRFQRAMCDTSIRLAEIVGAGPRILSALEQLCERWDGRGVPGRVEGESLLLPMRLQQMGHIIEIAHSRGGRAAALAVVRRRAGRQFDPRLARVFLEEQGPLFEAIEDRHVFERFLRLEPEPVSRADEQRMEDVARALAIFTDLKCPIFLAHSTGVAALAERAAGYLGFGDEDTRALRLACLLHDLGRLSVPNGIWAQAGSLDWSAWERVRLHSHYTGRILSPVGPLAEVANIAAAAHERLDASGYPQRRAAPSLSSAAQVLAVADMAFAMSEERPYRPALGPEVIARELVAEAAAGRLDAKAVDAVLASLGLPNRTARAEPHGLSERELEVAQLLARGKSNKEIGAQLHISPRTVQVHVGRIFEKLQVRSRAGAAIWLIQHDLVR